MNFHSLENANPYSNPIKETIVPLIDSRAPSLLEERKHIFQYSDLTHLFTLLQSSIFNIPQIISEANADHDENASQQSAVSDGMPPTPATPFPKSMFTSTEHFTNPSCSIFCFLLLFVRFSYEVGKY